MILEPEQGERILQIADASSMDRRDQLEYGADEHGRWAYRRVEFGVMDNGNMAPVLEVAFHVKQEVVARILRYRKGYSNQAEAQAAMDKGLIEACSNGDGTCILSIPQGALDIVLILFMENQSEIPASIGRFVLDCALAAQEEAGSRRIQG